MTLLQNLARTYLEFCLTQSLKQIITRPKTGSLIKLQPLLIISHILTNSLEKVTQSGVIDLSLSGHGLI